MSLEIFYKIDDNDNDLMKLIISINDVGLRQYLTLLDLISQDLITYLLKLVP